MSSPDIPNSASPWVVGGLLSLVAVGVGAAVYVFMPSNNNKKEPEITRFEGISLPSGFLSAPKKETPKVEPIKKQVIIKRPHKKPHKQIVKIHKPKAILQSKPVKSQAQIKLEKQRAAINAARLGSSISMSVKDDTFNGAASWTNSQEDYSDEGIIPKYASYPVDLSRTITADRNISAVLVEEINSELSGKITAQIDHNIYGAHGRNILIPAGSKAIGQYISSNSIGQRRITAIWNRIITPSGININIAAPVAGMMGRSGLGGNVNNRLAERFGMALLVSTISAAGQMNVPVNNANQQVAVNSLTTQLSQVSNAAIQQNFDLKPIITIPAGKLIQISIREDIWFKKAEKNGYTITTRRGK